MVGLQIGGLQAAGCRLQAAGCSPGGRACCASGWLDDGEGGLVESRSTTEMQSNWLPNSASDVCMNARCGKPFTLTRRRHHCRECGGLFCSKCLQQRKVASGQGLKVCDACAA